MAGARGMGRGRASAFPSPPNYVSSESSLKYASLVAARSRPGGPVLREHAGCPFLGRQGAEKCPAEIRSLDYSLLALALLVPSTSKSCGACWLFRVHLATTSPRPFS